MLNLWTKLFGNNKGVVQDIPEPKPEPKPLNISEPTYLIEKYLRSNLDKLESIDSVVEIFDSPLEKELEDN